MVCSCSAYRCTNQSKKGSPIQFFKFPLKDPKRLRAWVVAMRREDFKPTKHSVLCSDHFLESDINVVLGGKVNRLKPTAVPSIFPGFPSKLQREIKLECEIYEEEIKFSALEVDIKNVKLPVDEHSYATSKEAKEMKELQNLENICDNIQQVSDKNHKTIKKKYEIQKVVVIPPVSKEVAEVTTFTVRESETQSKKKKPIYVDESTQTDLSGITIDLYKRQIKSLQQQVRRQKIKINYMKDLLKKSRS